MVRKAALILALVAAPICAQDFPDPDYEDSHLFLDNWQPFYETESGTIFYIKGRDLKNALDNKFPKFWYKGDHKADKTVEYRTTLTLVHINCPNWTFGFSAMVAYDANGDTVLNWNGAPEMAPIIPDTVGEDMAEAICPMNVR